MPIDPDRLRPISLFAGLTDDDLARLGALLEERHVEPGEHLAREGASGYFFFVILDGHAEVSRDGQAVAALGPGNFFGESAILETVRRTSTVTATSPMTVGAMFGADFAKFQADHPEMHARVMQALAERRVVET